ncbi:MAG: hypothetical protein K2X01_01090 [Cyanobacteria bacterium]|nr:hypothetical protein [Cyanobacteriota bacterium]
MTLLTKTESPQLTDQSLRVGQFGTAVTSQFGSQFRIMTRPVSSLSLLSVLLLAALLAVGVYFCLAEQAFAQNGLPPQPLGQPCQLDISRSDIQAYFTSDMGDSLRHPAWRERYSGKKVHWSGRVYKVRHYPESFRYEVLIQVLPEVFTYDTLVVLEGNSALDPGIHKGVSVKFSGQIFGGVDALGIKEVYVLLLRPEDLTINTAGP